jgi:MATE family multidrug resistance protein
MLQETINLIFIGQMNDPVKLAAVGMGNMIVNMFGVGTYFGLNSALETLVSQAYGSNEIWLCGLYLQRGRVINALTFIPMFVLFSYCGSGLKLLGQDERVADQAHLYILAMSPGIFLLGLADL